MKQILYERLIQHITENQERFYRVAYSYTRHQEDASKAGFSISDGGDKKILAKSQINNYNKDKQGGMLQDGRG